MDFHHMAPSREMDISNAAMAPAIAEYNLRIPLSPSVRSDSGASEAASSESEEEKEERVNDNHFRIGVQRWNRYRYDHPRALGDTPTPTPSVPFELLKLPFEIRREILSLLVKQEKQLKQKPANGDTPHDGKKNAHQLFPVDVRLFAVSRQMKIEAEEVFYHGNTFFIDVNKSLPLFITQFADDNIPRAVHGLTKIHIKIPYLAQDTQGSRQHTKLVRDERREKMEILSQVLAKCRRIELLKIIPNC